MGDSMALDTAFLLVQELLKLNAFVLLGLVFATAFIAYKLFAIVLRILVTGVAFGTFPFIANFIGIAVPITVQTILWSALAGIFIYFAYVGISFGMKIISLAFAPFKRAFPKKEKRQMKKLRKDAKKLREESEKQKA